MGIAVWGAAVGALLGFILGDFSEFGFFAGGVLGGGMGAWLRKILRREIEDAVRRALPTGDMPAAPPVQMPPPSPVSPRRPAETARVVSASDAPLAAPAQEPAVPDAAVAPVPQAGAAVPLSHAQADPGPLALMIGKVRGWLLGGNTIVRVGIVILFLGLVFLVRFAAMAGLFPIETRLALVGAAGVALLAIGLGSGPRVRPSPCPCRAGALPCSISSFLPRRVDMACCCCSRPSP